MTNWQEIETAPKTGAELLGGWAGLDVVDLIWWDLTAKRWRWNGVEEGDHEPTHWQPLPDPPVEA